LITERTHKTRKKTKSTNKTGDADKLSTLENKDLKTQLDTTFRQNGTREFTKADVKLETKWKKRYR
jgi:hypothetical protein